MRKLRARRRLSATTPIDELVTQFHRVSLALILAVVAVLVLYGIAAWVFPDW